jgi:hypothetical protein
VESATELQRLLERRVRGELAARGWREPTIEWGAFEAPFYNPGRPEPIAHLVTERLSVWLYDDGAAFTLDGINDRFERASFSSDKSFADAFMAELCKTLDR